MAKKEFRFMGLSKDELKRLDEKKFLELIPARQRRSLKRGLSDTKKKLLTDIKKGKRNIETHCRDMIILPSMIDATVKVYQGKEYVPVTITPEMVGHYLGEFALT